jgi:DNA-binding SARP family transcriptional activator/predicted ATPase
MEFAVLGPLEVTGPDGPLPLGPPKQRLLLALLLCQPGVPAPAWSLLDQSWGGNAPSTARDNLRLYMHRLRRLLGADRVVRRAAGYVLVAQQSEVDALRFTDLLTACQRLAAEGQTREAYGLLEAALGEWRGPAYGDLDAPAIRAEASRLEELRLAAVETKAEAGLALGRHATVAAELSSLIRQHPYRERLLGQLMLALYRSGRQVEALEAYRNARRRMVDELGLEPGTDLQRLEHRILTADPSLAPAERIAVARMGPDLVRDRDVLVGRAGELDRLRRLLTEHSTLTLTGPPGVGKSRLARELHPDWIVGVGGIGDAADLPAAVAHAIGTREGRRGLLLLDNCEHLVGPCAALVDSNPQLTILVTSRQPLSAPSEVLYRLPALSVPGGDSASAVLASDSGRLFEQRAQLADVSFTVTDGNAATVAQICRVLDGLPLAIRLAARQLASMTLTELAAQLEACLDLFSSPDEGSLREAIDRSYRTLDEDDRLALAELTVFPASFPSDVAADAKALYRLVERSLVVAEPDAAGGRATAIPRYRLLHIVRQYAEQLQDGSGRVEQARHRLVRYYCGLAEVAGGRWRMEPAWSSRLLAESENLRAAITIGLDTEPQSAMRAVAALGWLWEGYPASDLMALADRAVVAAESAAPDLRMSVLVAAAKAWRHASPARARRYLDQGLAHLGESRPGVGALPLLLERSWLCGMTGEIDAALAAAREAHRVAGEAGNPAVKGEAVAALGYLLGQAGHWDAGEHLVRAAEVIFEQGGDMAGRAEAARLRGEVAAIEGDASDASRLLTPFATTPAPPLHRARALVHLGWAQWRLDAPDEARSALAEGLRAYAAAAVRSRLVPWVPVVGLLLAARIAGGEGDSAAAAGLLAVIDSVHKEYDLRHTPLLQRIQDGIADRAGPAPHQPTMTLDRALARYAAPVRVAT